MKPMSSLLMLISFCNMESVLELLIYQGVSQYLRQLKFATGRSIYLSRDPLTTIYCRSSTLLRLLVKIPLDFCGQECLGQHLYVPPLNLINKVIIICTVVSEEYCTTHSFHVTGASYSSRSTFIIIS